MEFETSISLWECPHHSTPDLLHPGFKDIQHIGRPLDGNVMIGLFNLPQWYEDVQIPLRMPLEIGKTYYVEFWLARSKSIFNPAVKLEDFISSNFGILFTSEPINEKSSTVPFIAKPQIHCPKKLWLTSKWEKIAGLLTAQKAHKFITIGQFRDTTAERPNVTSGYVLLDKLTIEELSDIKQISELSIPPLEGTIIPLEAIYFEENKAKLLDSSIPALDHLFETMLLNPAIKLSINGHTDAKGNKESNKLLSEHRAMAVYDFLIKKGIEKSRLSWKAFGESKPKYDNTSKQKRILNRRVELEFLK